MAQVASSVNGLSGVKCSLHSRSPEWLKWADLLSHAFFLLHQLHLLCIFSREGDHDPVTGELIFFS